MTEFDALYLTAAASGDLSALGAALAAGADKNALDREEASAILLAARGRHYDVVTAVIEAGVDLKRLTRFSGNGLTPLRRRGTSRSCAISSRTQPST